MSLSVWFGLLAICCLGAMSPGPSLAMVIRHTVGGSRLHGIVCAWTHSIGIGFYALITLFGLAIIFKQSPLLFNSISLMGAGYLAWMGVKALGSNGGMEQKLAKGDSASLWQAARDGLAISLFNPKILLFFLALFSQFVRDASDHVSQIIIVVTPLLTDGIWYTIIALILSHPAVLPKLREKSIWIDKLSGIVLLLLAARVLFTLEL
ncbi:LysE family translocator [Parashewanella spongiae]|uniref:LysE family translocator n=1 Tax=Parashewanella spongiae TaxID=342950 RepID=A0A3A6ULF4_9GAMM|nr:LysE family translocator [Parashewanella spongiae]MCL1076690.1 LysE family translocator [Parashewanella spongiae]RJY18498.1 LysE family translocator [Parashewanella spongiae]